MPIVWTPPGWDDHRAPAVPEEGIAAPGFTVRNYGGPGRINLEWDSLKSATVHIQDAADRFSVIRAELTSVYAAFDGSGWAHLHLGIPGFQANLGSLVAGAVITEQTLHHATAGIVLAEQAYRSAEATVHAYFHLAIKVAETQLALEHIAHEDGDSSYAYNWAVTTGVGFSWVGIDVLQKKFPKLAMILKTIAAVEKHAGLSAALMGRNDQVVAPQPVHQFSHQADGSLAGYLGQMGDVADYGDIAVSVIPHGPVDPVYAVHLPELDIDETDLGHGRGPMSLIDGLRNESAHMTEAVEYALNQVGAPAHAEVFLTGFSLGGLHATNIAKNSEFQERFNLRAVTTIGSPVTSGATRPGVKVTHFEDGRDPVPRITGERPQLSSDRMVIEYHHHNPERARENIAGTAHDWENNVEAIELYEAHEAHHRDQRTTHHVDEFRAQLNQGEQIETFVFETSWQRSENPDHILPWEAESMEDLEYLDDALKDGVKELRKWPHRDTTSSPGTINWKDAKKTLPQISD